MNTKEAINFLEYIVKDLLIDEVGLCNSSGVENVKSKVDNIIELFKRGEKYEKIFNTILNWTMHDGDFIPAKVLIELEQEYFPKGV